MVTDICSCVFVFHVEQVTGSLLLYNHQSTRVRTGHMRRSEFSGTVAVSRTVSSVFTSHQTSSSSCRNTDPTVGSTFHLLQTRLSDNQLWRWTQTASALILLHWSIQTGVKASIDQWSINKLLLWLRHCFSSKSEDFISLISQYWTSLCSGLFVTTRLTLGHFLTRIVEPESFPSPNRTWTQTQQAQQQTEV